MVALDDPAFAARVARQAGVVLGVEIANHHMVAQPEPRRHRLVDPRRTAGIDQHRNDVLGDDRHQAVPFDSSAHFVSSSAGLMAPRSWSSVSIACSQCS